jgi:hypothetical protein
MHQRETQKEPSQTRRLSLYLAPDAGLEWISRRGILPLEIPTRILRRASFAGSRPTLEDMKRREPQFLGLSSFLGSGCWTRTSDLMINSHPLYQLS